MKRLSIVICSCVLALAGNALAQAPGGAGGNPAAKPAAVKSVAAPARSVAEPVPATPSPVLATSPGETQVPREVRAHEMYLLQSQAQAESVRRAAAARADQRTRRLESQRWFGLSNTRPMCSTDPFNGDYSPFWASNYPYYPLRWVGGGQNWGFVESQ